jgi:hypothetical protein
MTDTAGKTYDVRPLGGDSSNESWETEVQLKGPPLGFFGNKAQRIESLGIKQYVSFCKDAKITMADFNIAEINLTYKARGPLIITHPTPGHDFDYFATKCSFKYAVDAEPFLTTNSNNSVVTAYGSSIGTTTRALTATI